MSCSGTDRTDAAVADQYHLERSISHEEKSDRYDALATIAYKDRKFLSGVWNDWCASYHMWMATWHEVALKNPVRSRGIW